MLHSCKDLQFFLSNLKALYNFFSSNLHLFVVYSDVNYFPTQIVYPEINCYNERRSFHLRATEANVQLLLTLRMVTKMIYRNGLF